MITFRHKSNAKQIKIKTKRELNERMSPWLQDLFDIKNPIVGFKVANSIYLIIETNITMLKPFTQIKTNFIIKSWILSKPMINSRYHVGIH